MFSALGEHGHNVRESHLLGEALLSVHVPLTVGFLHLAETGGCLDQQLQDVFGVVGIDEAVLEGDPDELQDVGRCHVPTLCPDTRDIGVESLEQTDTELLDVELSR